jgi:hypothetical protein
MKPTCLGLRVFSRSSERSQGVELRRARICGLQGIGGCPQARWSDDLRRTARGSWMRVAEDRVNCRAIGEGYVQQ